jgi:putative ABC transport system permease protein
MYRPLVVEGRWLEPGDGKVVVMSKETADDEKLNVGDKVVLDMGEWGKEEWTIIGLYRVFMLLSGGGFTVDSIYAPREAVYGATKKTGRATTLLVRTFKHQPNDVKQVTDLLENKFRQNHIDIASTETIVQLRQLSDSSFSIVIMMLLVLAVIVALVGGIGLMGSLWISVIERTKEIGIMRAIGGSSMHIQGMFMLEAAIQGMLSWFFAVIVALILTPILSNLLGQTMFQARLDYQFNYPAVLIWLAIMLVLSILASIIPARNASQINVRQCISYE